MNIANSTIPLQIVRLNDRMAYVKKRLVLDQSIELIDVISDHWALISGGSPEQEIRVKRQGNWFPARGCYRTFLPPFSIVHWALSPGVYEIETIISDLELPEDTSKEPVAFFSAGDETPKSLGAVIQALENSRGAQIEIGAIQADSATARRTKSAIDGSYRESGDLSDIARDLGFSPAVMSRAFKACYGLSPSAYAKKLRLNEVRKLLTLADRSIQESAMDVGFNNIALFNRQFKNEYLITPSSFRSLASSSPV